MIVHVFSANLGFSI